MKYFLWTLSALALVGILVFGHSRPTKPEIPKPLIERIHTTDTLYVRDSVKYVVLRDRFKTLHDTLSVTDTTALNTVFAQADSIITACDTALADEERRIAARDSTIDWLVNNPSDWLIPPQKRLTGAIEALWSPVRQEPSVRLSTTLHLYGDVNATAAVDASFSHSDIRIGLKKVF